MVPLHFLTPRYDLPVVPMNINCQGPPVGAAPSSLGARARRCAARRTRSWSESRSSAPAASRTGRRPRIPERSTRPGIGNSWRRWQANDRAALLSYTDEATYRDAGQGGFEIRTFIAVAAAAQGRGEYSLTTAPFPMFAVGCTVADMSIEGA